MATKLSAQYLEGFVKPQECEAMAPQVKLAHEALHAGTGLGNDFLGWIKNSKGCEKDSVRYGCFYRNRNRRLLSGSPGGH